MEKEYKIVEDDNVIVTYQTIETAEINRNEVEQNEKLIAEIEQEIAKLNETLIEKNAKLEELKAKVEFDKMIIALADEQKINENSQEVVIE